MFLQSFEINPAMSVAEIVLKDYRTADVFRKYGIEYCCGGKWPLDTVCMMNDISWEKLHKELQSVTRAILPAPVVDFATWKTDFLTNYIIHVHHQYLKDTLAQTGDILTHFAAEHVKKYPYFIAVQEIFEKLKKNIFPHLQQQEDTVFPYIRQIAHAYENKDSYAKLLVKTLRKPLDGMMRHEQQIILSYILQIRELTNDYKAPAHACVSHKVTLSRLMELDNNLMQHIHLENEILFPRAIQIEQELLQ